MEFRGWRATRLCQGLTMKMGKLDLENWVVVDGLLKFEVQGMLSFGLQALSFIYWMRFRVQEHRKHLGFYGGCQVGEWTTWRHLQSLSGSVKVAILENLPHGATCRASLVL